MAEEKGLLLHPCGCKHSKSEMRIRNKKPSCSRFQILVEEKEHNFHSFFTENLILQNTLFHPRNFPAMHVNPVFYRPVQEDIGEV